MCPGCGRRHQIKVAPHPEGWGWNGDFDQPTITPSILSKGGQHICHAYITNGQIQYLADSTHALAGQTVNLPECQPW